MFEIEIAGINRAIVIALRRLLIFCRLGRVGFSRRFWTCAGGEKKREEKEMIQFFHTGFQRYKNVPVSGTLRGLRDLSGFDYLSSMHRVYINEREYRVDYDGKKGTIDDRPIDADILEYREGKFHVLLKGKSYTAELLEVRAAEKTFLIKVNQSVFSVNVRDKYDELLREMGIDMAKSKMVNDVKAPMPGLVLRVMVNDGQPIQKGDALLVLEAMKMENILKSPSDGIVKKVHVIKGDKVEKNQVMLVLT